MNKMKLRREKVKDNESCLNCKHIGIRNILVYYNQPICTISKKHPTFLLLCSEYEPKVKCTKEQLHEISDLIDGEIYTSDENYAPVIIRKLSYTPIEGLYCNCFIVNEFESLKHLRTNDLFRPATIYEKKKLITAEVKNGHFYNLK